MGFMEDVGRSNALSSVNNLMGKAIDIRRGEDQSAERAYTVGLQTEKFGLEKESAAREATKFGWAAEEQAKKQKFNKTVVPVDTILQNARPGSREKLLKLGKDNGWIQDIGGNLVISNENLANAKQYLKENLEFTSQLALTDVADINKEMIPLKQQLAELTTTKPDDKSIPILQKRIADLDKQKTMHLNSALEIDKAYQEKKALEETKQTGKIVKGPDGGLYRQKEDGTMEELVAPPEKETKPPPDRRRDVGAHTLTEEWEDGAWVEVSRAPRWNTRGDAIEARKTKQETFKNEQSMRKEFEALPEVKDFTAVSIAAGQMDAAYAESKKTKNFVAVDQALITMFNKMTDAKSVVRESEYLRTASDMAIWNRLKGKKAQLESGGAGITAEERTALKTISDRFMKASSSRYNKVATEYKRLATEYGYKPENVVFRNTIITADDAPKTADDFLKKYGGK